MTRDPRGEFVVSAGPRPVEYREVTSTKSDRVSQVRRLHERRHRQSDGAFVVEGPTNVAAAIDAHGATSVFVTGAFQALHPELLAAIDGLSDGVREVVTVTDAVMDAMSETRQSQGVLAICPRVTRPLDSLAPLATDVLGESPTMRPQRWGTWVVLDRANDPGNAGTIIRTAEACGAGAVLFTEGSVDPHNGKCVRASAGAIFRIPVVVGVAWDDVRAAAQGRPVVATSADGEIALGTPEAEQVLGEEVIWLFGTEAHGLPPDVLADADHRLRIPMPGRAESLNVASAAAICLFEGQRARGRQA